MLVKQISVFLENKSGRIAEVADVLGKNNINISALSIADTADFGIMRLIVSRPDDALKYLKEEGFTVSSTEVIAVEVSDQPGGLAVALKVLDQAGISIEYLYAFASKCNTGALVIFRVEDRQGAIDALQKRDIKVLKGQEVYSL